MNKWLHLASPCSPPILLGGAESARCAVSPFLLPRCTVSELHSKDLGYNILFQALVTRYPQSGDTCACEMGTSSLSHGSVAPFIKAISQNAKASRGK